MKTKPIKVLQIEDDPAAVRLIREFLLMDSPPQFEIIHADRLANGLAEMIYQDIDVILLDLELPDSRGLATFEKIISSAPDVPIVVMSSLDDDDLAIRILHAGAQEYLVKGDTNAPFLKRALRYAIGAQRLQRELDQRTQDLRLSEDTFRELIESMADGVVIVDALGNLRFLNLAAETLFGRKAEELIGESFGFPVVVGETVELNIRQRSGNARIAEMRVAEIIWDGQKAYLASLRDISARLEDEKQMRFQATLMQNISDAIIATDMDYRITSWNEAAEKTYGWKPDEVLGELLSEKLTPEYPAASRDQVTQSFVEDGAWQGEVIHHHKNRTPLHIFGSVSMLKDNYNNPIGAVSVNRDITEQKKIAQKLAQSEKRYRTLAEAAQDFIFIINPDMRVEYLNDFGAAVFRRNPKEIIGTPLAELFPHTAPELGESLQLVFQTGEPLYQENPIEFPDRVLWLGTRLAPITNASGETTAVLGLARDITETKAVEAALLKSEALYQDLYNNAPDMYVSVEAASGIILQCNRTLEIATGYTQDEIVGHPIFKLYHPDSLPGAQNAFQTFAATGEIHDAELQLRRKDGSEIDVSLNVSAVRDAAGNILSSRSSWRDITERKQMELALQEYSERLEDMVAERTRDLETAQDQLVRQEKLTVLGKLAGGLAHELRTPLNTIKNVAHFLGMALENPDAEVSQSLKILDNAADNADRVITSLLSFARPQIPSRQIVNLPEFINTLLARFNIPKNITLQMELSAAPQEISADPNHLEIVLNNLIRNALQAMPDGGNLEIWATLQTEPESRQDWISVAVRDSGAGISDENMARLFEPLFSTKVKGFGLGLVISEMLVKGHGGRIEVESLPGQGSSFTMLLPVDPLPFF